MSKFGKLLLRFLVNPASLKFRQIEKLLLKLGCEKIQAKGSHVKFKHPLVKNDLIFPLHGCDCKKDYKELARDYVQKNKLIDYEKNSETMDNG
jgi:predicted RNA binding protein YcfA (HicA-like mRNA interferase family)